MTQHKNKETIIIVSMISICISCIVLLIVIFNKINSYDLVKQKDLYEYDEIQKTQSEKILSYIENFSDKRCQKIGFIPGSQKWINCVDGDVIVGLKLYY